MVASGHEKYEEREFSRTFFHLFAIEKDSHKLGWGKKDWKNCLNIHEETNNLDVFLE